MQVVVGHANPDFDAYASAVAATKLYPGARCVFLGSQNTNVRSFHNLHEEFLDFVDLKGLDLSAIDRVIMVDTRDPDRIGELGSVVRRPGVEVVIYDHHPLQAGDFEGGEDRSLVVGATTSILVREISERALVVTALEASLMLLGIHEDTGSLTFPGTTAMDVEAAAWLMANGADIEVLNQFLSRTLDAEQRVLLEKLTESLETWDVNGQQIAIGVADSDDYVDSAGILSHYVVEDLGFRVAIALVSMPERIQIVARSRRAEVDVGAAMGRLGGGGHPQAASAVLRGVTVADALAQVRAALAAVVRQPLCAVDIMSQPVRFIAPDASMQEAGDQMARWGHGSLPVMNNGVLQGIVTRKDVDKAKRHGLAHAPVTGFMTRDLPTVAPDVDLFALEELLAARGVGRVPVVEDGRLVGIVTRKDVLRAEHGEGYVVAGVRTSTLAAARFAAGADSALPHDAREVLRKLGALAVERGERAHVVGGFVRDILLGEATLDIDVVIEGDGVEFASAFSARNGAPLKVHRRFGTAVLTIGPALHVDIASARTEYYLRPGALPTVERSSLRQDLSRRDFTINAMAATLEPGRFGAIADPFGGLGDLDAGVVRALHALSFVEDPTRILRAARFEQRYGFRMDEGTEGLASGAAHLDMLGEVSGARLREELLDILAEKSPSSVLERLESLGALSQLLPAGAVSVEAPAALRAVEDALESLLQLFARPPKPAVALVSALATLGVPGSAERWLRHFRLGREYSSSAEMLAEHGSSTLARLSDRRGMRDSRLYRLLNPLPAACIAVLWARGEPGVRERIERYLRELSCVRPAVSGRDLIAAGVTPAEGFSAILARALDDRLDDRVVGREAELANLLRIARRAGLLDPRKDPA